MKTPKVIRVRSIVRLAFRYCVKKDLHFRSKVLEFGCRYIPDDGVINPKIVMDQPISHSSDLSPFDIRLNSFDVIWYFF